LLNVDVDNHGCSLQPAHQYAAAMPVDGRLRKCLTVKEKHGGVAKGQKQGISVLCSFCTEKLRAVQGEFGV
jgi:hypothetical protein